MNVGITFRSFKTKIFKLFELFVFELVQFLFIEFRYSLLALSELQLIKILSFIVAKLIISLGLNFRIKISETIFL